MSSHLTFHSLLLVFVNEAELVEWRNVPVSCHEYRCLCCSRRMNERCVAVDKRGMCPPIFFFFFIQRHKLWSVMSKRKKKSMLTPWLFNKLPQPLTHSVLPDGRNFMEPVTDKLPKVIWSFSHESCDQIDDQVKESWGSDWCSPCSPSARSASASRLYHLLWSATCHHTTLERQLGRQHSFLSDRERCLFISSCQSVCALNVNLVLFWPSKQKLGLSGGNFMKVWLCK